MNFSPFQCENCKRVYTRKSLYTRHLKDVDQTGSQPKRGPSRECPNRKMDADEAFYIRKDIHAALWAIQTVQEQVDWAVSIIKRNNGALPTRRRRTQNQNESEPSEIRPLTLGTSPPFGNHPQACKFFSSLRLCGKVGTNLFCSAAQRFPPQPSPPYTQPYASSPPRTQSASEYFPQRVASAYTSPTETGSTMRRSPLAEPSPYQPPASYQGPQEPPIMPRGDIGGGYMDTDVGQPLYGPNSVYEREYMASLEQPGNIDPNMLQHVTSASHRAAWEGSRQDYPTWPTVRTGEHRQQVLYPNQEFKEQNYHYQSVS